MRQYSQNKYIQSLLENLITSYETEINYTPLEIELDSKQFAENDIDSLINFINDDRKRLFIFKIAENQQASNRLALQARRTALNKTAEALLKNTSSEPKINPLKYALNSNSPAVRARIQIQKSILLPTLPSVQEAIHLDQSEHVGSHDFITIPIESTELPELIKQLKALGIDNLQESALPLIKEHLYAFGDGIIPGNLPKGFYINKDKKALCYTDTPRKLPSALAPVLKKQETLTLPSVEEATALFPHLPQNTLSMLLETKYSSDQKNTLLSLVPTYENEIKSFLLQLSKSSGSRVLSPKQHDEFIIPLLCKQYVLGGEAHTNLLVRLLNACLNKKIDLEFLKNPEVQSSLLSTRGIKNLQKLTQLPSEQKEWWNTLVNAHLAYDRNSFDFNTFFDAYTQILLPRIAEKSLTLPNPCPIRHKGHFLITLNRVLDVIEHAKNPQEQCLSLSELNWGATGVHYAMLQKPASEQFKQVAACMHIENPEDTITDPELIYQQIDKEPYELKPWLFRYMGQHWKSEIRLTDIQDQLREIEKLASWTSVQKNQLTFILTCAFANNTALNPAQWKEALNNCIHSLQGLDSNDRTDLLQAFSRCFKFKPSPSLMQINTLIKQCIDFKREFHNKSLKDDFISPLVSCLENEGFELLNTLQERIQKTAPAEIEQFSLAVTASFTAMLQKNRQDLSPEIIKLFAKLNESDLSQDNIGQLLLTIQNIKDRKGELFHSTVLSTLSQINISKSQALPKAEQIQALLEALANSADAIPHECKTLEKQETWLKALIIEKNPFPGCVLGNGDISKLDDLIVDALVDAIKKRSAVFKIDILKAALQQNLQNFIVPQQLRDQLNRELIPLFDAVEELVNLLQSPNPQFPEVIEKLRFFEEKKPALLEGMYSLILGETKGEYILSFLLTGKRKATDQTTNKAFAAVLGPVHNLFLSQMKSFFDNPLNKKIVKDLDLDTCLSWMASFNETHSLTFFFKEELIEKKVLPALKKTLQQLNTQDPEFEKSILDEAALIDENAPADQALQSYKNKIESIANYLNLLIEINDRLPQQFIKIYKQLSTGTLARLNYKQKHTLVNKLIKSDLEKLDLYLKLTTEILEEHPNADGAAIERAIDGLVELFNLPDLEPDTQIMFFKMSIAHNLKSTTPFPLAALNKFKNSDLPEQIKSLIIKQIIQILVGLSTTDSGLIQELVEKTQLFLLNNIDQPELCIALLNRVSQDNSQNLSTYPHILEQLAEINPAENRAKVATILTGLAKNKKDSTVNLPALLEITKGLRRRLPADVDQVLKLFTTPPYPNAQSLNSALLAHDSEKINAYYLSFDTNPFAKTGEKRDLPSQFATDRIKDALLNLQDLIHEEDLPHSLLMKLARQLTYIETLGYTDPLNPGDFTRLKGLTACSRHDLKEKASTLLQQLRSQKLSPEQREVTHLELLGHLREIYFRTTGLFPNTTQMLVLLLALEDPSSNLLMRIKTGEGKSINTPMLSVLQWAQGGTVVQWTANPTLLIRDYENSCEPFFNFLGIKSALIQSNSPIESFIPNGINCSTVEDMASFHLAAKIAQVEKQLETEGPVHIVLDECDDALLDQVTLYKLVAEVEAANMNNPAQWIYPLAYQFINLPGFRNLNPAWDEDEDLDQFRLFLNKQINEQFNGDVEKQNYLMASSNTQLKQWIHASCVAATLVENKHFIMQPIKEKNEAGHEITKKIACVPLIRSTPKTGSIFTESVQQALQARLKAERKDQAQYICIDTVPSVLGSQSARGLIKFFQKTLGRLLGISATPGDKNELESLATSVGTQAISVAPYAGDKRINHPPIFTLNRGETIKAIHETFKKIKRPVTKPTMEINPDETILPYDETLIVQRKNAIEKWSHTQTQPILIVNEDFDEAQAIGNSLKLYEEQGFKIQIITGKESSAELDKIIKQAGQANTITVGTAMLAKGIDINTGDHPKGLFVIQTYPDTERMTTQIAGRAARNGKPGEWLPIYQVKAPEDLLNKFFYYVFPWTRQRINEHTIEVVRDKIKLQATVDRTYTQSIDEAQQILMLQIEAWESLLLELYPDDPKMLYELYQWREMLLSELTRSQDTNVSEHSLYESIAQFKKSACKFWESAREEKWAAKAAKANMSSEQSLRFKYLKELDFLQELNIQARLQQKGKQFTAAKKALMHQNLETVIADKAGAVLEYTKPSEQARKELELAQTKQILPNLIGEFCAVCPNAIKIFFPKNTSQNSYFIPEIVRKGIDKLIEQKNKVLHGDEQKEVTDSIINFYQKKLKDADSKQIQELLAKMKPLILNHCSDFKKFSLVEQFKMQGLILSFSTLYRNLDLPEDANLNELRIGYDAEIMKKLAEYLLNEFAWVKENPVPLHAFFERTDAKNAALVIYNLANNLINSPQDQDAIRDLYTALQQHKVILKDKYLFSISHSSPRKVINDALDAIDSLNNAPNCDIHFRQNCHDKVISEHQIAAFRKLLTRTSPYFFKTNDPTWEHMKNALLSISNQSKENPSHIIHELYEATTRFSTYKAYQPYLNQLNALQKQLARSIEELGKDDGLNQDVQESLFSQKQSQFAALLKVDPKKIRIQNGTDGIQSYIEIQVEDAPLQEGFTGYQSSFLTRVDSERGKLKTAQSTLDKNKDALLQLADEKAIEALPERKHAEFKKLFRLKALLTLDWNNLNIDRHELPDLIRQKMQYVDEMKRWNWKLNPVDQNRLQVIFGKIPNERYSVLIREQSRINDELIETRKRMHDISEQISAHEKEIENIDKTIKAASKRKKEADCSYWESGQLTAKNLLNQRSINFINTQIEQLAETLTSIQEEETECLDALNDHNEKLDINRKELITQLLNQTKLDLASYLDETSKKQVALTEQEFRETEPVIERLEKEERQKTCYQTRRFFKTSELLRYEASLAGEEAKILLSEQEEDVQNAAALVY
ncbi:helicase-related protein [Fluoribacter gormanii]|uniref:helicase-related protein n=1 Tax=Fluoribacter gormanii TaxID=464 RepID=UPI001041911E|nr:helicase-related protein [Fluoribacter gormanii]